MREIMKDLLKPSWPCFNYFFKEAKLLSKCLLQIDSTHLRKRYLLSYFCVQI